MVGDTGNPNENFSMPPNPLSAPHLGPEQRGWEALHSPIWWHLDPGAQQVLRRAVGLPDQVAPTPWEKGD